MHKNFYTVRELHKIIGGGTSIANIYNQIRVGKIPATYIGNRTLIPGYWVEDFCRMFRCSTDFENKEEKSNG